MADDHVYVALSSEEHKQIRSGILKGQAHILHILKRITKIQRLKRERETAKHKLVQQYLVLLEKIEKLDELIPDTELPEELRIKAKKRVPKKVIQEAAKRVKIPKAPIEESSFVEDELLAVQEQLKRLTG